MKTHQFSHNGFSTKVERPPGLHADNFSKSDNNTLKQIHAKDNKKCKFDIDMLS